MKNTQTSLPIPDKIAVVAWRPFPSGGPDEASDIQNTYDYESGVSNLISAGFNTVLCDVSTIKEEKRDIVFDLIYESGLRICFMKSCINLLLKEFNKTSNTDTIDQRVEKAWSEFNNNLEEYSEYQGVWGYLLQDEPKYSQLLPTTSPSLPGEGDNKVCMLNIYLRAKSYCRPRQCSSTWWQRKQLIG